MPCKTGKCCCCIPIRCGTNIIGGLHAIYLFYFLYSGEFVGASLNFFAGTTFIIMLVKDSAMMRGIFCAAFTTYVCMILVLNLYYTFFKIGEDKKMFDMAVR